MLNFKKVNIIASFLCLGLFILFLFYDFSLIFFYIGLFIWFLLTAAGSAFIGWNYHVQSLNSNYKTTHNQIAITFDDGPNPEFTPQVLQLLKTYNVKATFFCIGKQVESHPDLFDEIIENDHVVGNHTYSHSNYFGFFGAKKVELELERTSKIIEKQSGLKPLLYRPAFGVTNPNIKRALNRTGLQSIGWSKRSLDTTGLDENAVLKRITTNLKAGDVILLHDSSQKTIIVLEQLLLFLQEQNLTSVTVDTLFDIKAYA
ncbi:polysaccharide deacetylase family protein [Tamlana sp. 2_MG-2023]|uniref:polysaccharide deacetylase family protein n=1 Tax=unclassified Tamlana TaxID=2614803 RepID=UPI0026E45C5A|nr:MULTISPECIES: polysaccharide deacetylase family protein [unclassified Tamlana]MDO6758599.1 polysaccharide deacetylase family protein [Tamlana sp. 2_MG-2023]MDO6789298.1 polysaccharide deacetylase family protein [Tamlana sp. 1_MG-2023]